MLENILRACFSVYRECKEYKISVKKHLKDLETIDVQIWLSAEDHKYLQGWHLITFYESRENTLAAI